ncbi:MAG: hypothetical protein WAO58_08705 [Fimbriimonadaceae bacterium]
MRFSRAFIAAAAALVISAGCAVDADDTPDVVTPGSTTVIEKDTPDVNVNPPDVNVTTPPSTTTTTTGG